MLGVPSDASPAAVIEAAYRRLARKAGKIWREHGALEYRECVGEDLDVKMGMPFPALVKPKKGETIVFAWIVYKSRAHRDRVNAKVGEVRVSDYAFESRSSHLMWRVRRSLGLEPDMPGDIRLTYDALPLPPGLIPY